MKIRPKLYLIWAILFIFFILFCERLQYDMNTTPIADFSISPESGAPGEEISFNPKETVDLQDDYEDMTCYWDYLNDGTTNLIGDCATKAVLTNTIALPDGLYPMKLIVKDSGGLTNSIVKYFLISSDIVKQK